MGASRYIGRVGGLAVAFGIGTAVLTGYGVASADTTAGGDSGSSSQGSAGGGASDSTESTSSTQDSTGSGSSQSVSDADDTAIDPDADSVAEAAAAEAADEAAAAEAADEAAAEAADEAAAEAAAEEEADLSNEAAVDEADSASGDAAVIKSAALATPVLDVVNDVADPVDEPTMPAGSPMDWAAAAAARREIAAIGDPIVIDPTYDFVDGVIYGNVNAEGEPATDYIYTLTEAPTAGGKVFLGRTDPADPTKTIQDGSLNYLPFLDEDSPFGAFAPEQFTVMVSELSDLMKALKNIPLLGSFVESTVLALQQMPFIGSLLQPIIGYRAFAVFDVDVDAVVPDGVPVAYTTKVTSFDGVQISTNWFPAVPCDTADCTATSVFEGPGLGADGNINPTGVIGTLGFVPGMSLLRQNPEVSSLGFNYVSWDPRGEGDSGGFLQLDNPFYEGRDTQHIIDYVATLPWTALSMDSEGAPIAGDPQMGMVGGSYGGGIQNVEAPIDRRVDTIVPAASWYSLNESLYPTADFKTSWAILLGLDLLEAGARINSQIYPAIIEGTLTGRISESDQAILSSSGPTVLMDLVEIPALYIQGTVDGLFPLDESTTNVGILASNGLDVRLLWACGGHGVCLTQEGQQATEQFTNISTATLTWLTYYVAFFGALGPPPFVETQGVPGIPRFQWYDQKNELFTSELLPSDPAFYGDPFVTTNAAGGSLLLQPLCCGGSGPQLDAVNVVGAQGLLVSPALAAPARDAINIPIAGPLLTTEMVGAPKLSFTYSGVGTSRHVYAQLVDDATNLVLGNIITPIPVELDGTTRQVVEMDLESIAYTMTAADSLTLQIVGATSVYADATQWGFIEVSDVELELPTVAGAGAVAGAVAGGQEIAVAV